MSRNSNWRDVYGGGTKDSCPSDGSLSFPDFDPGYRSSQDNMCHVFVYRNNYNCTGMDLNSCLHQRCQKMFRRGALEAFFHSSMLEDTGLPSRHQGEYVATGYSIERPTAPTEMKDPAHPRIKRTCNVYPLTCFSKRRCPTLMWCTRFRDKSALPEQEQMYWFSDNPMDRLPPPQTWKGGTFPKCRNMIYPAEDIFRDKPIDCDKMEYDLHVCTFPPYLNCHKRRYKGCTFNEAKNACHSYYYVTITKAVPPYGIDCPKENLGSKCKCVCKTTVWQPWSEWSSTCGIAHRKRYRPYDGLSHKCIGSALSQCCTEIEEREIGTDCTDYIYNTSVYLRTMECYHGEKVRDANDHLKCHCHRGYQGLLCNIEINACHSMPCRNHGTCINVGDHYVCHCATPEYTGQQCEIKQPQCNETACKYKSKCLNRGSYYSCQCPSLRAGAYCQNYVESCDQDTVCSRRGVCKDTNNNTEYRCVCDKPFTGKDCEYCAAFPNVQNQDIYSYVADIEHKDFYEPEELETHPESQIMLIMYITAGIFVILCLFLVVGRYHVKRWLKRRQATRERDKKPHTVKTMAGGRSLPRTSSATSFENSDSDKHTETEK